MKYRLFFIFSWLAVNLCYGQYQFEGQLAEDTASKTVYLSVIEDYRKLSRVYLEQIFRKTTTDSVGFFRFEGANLPIDNRIYRIHIDDCADMGSGSNHIFGKCTDTKSITFIANNKDTLFFPRTFEDEVLCDITSTNPSSDALLQIDVLKEEMVFDFGDFRSEANRKLNTKMWFDQLQEFGTGLNDPLAELYIYDFLSDRRNETYNYYLNDVAENDYYLSLQNRLQKVYGDAPFARLYTDEIAVDKQIRPLKNPSGFNWKWLLIGLLAFSVVLNLYLWRRNKAKNTDNPMAKLTAQERKIVACILEDKTNKEIATDLFISHSTVKTHINNLYKKLSVSTREEVKSLF